MATISTALEAPYNSFGKNNGVIEYILSGASGAGGKTTVKAAVTSSQIYFKGHIFVSGATTISLYSGDSGAGGLLLYTVVLAAAGPATIPLCHTVAGALLQLVSSANVTVTGIIATLPVTASRPVPSNWQI